MKNIREHISHLYSHHKKEYCIFLRFLLHNEAYVPFGNELWNSNSKRPCFILSNMILAAFVWPSQFKYGIDWSRLSEDWENIIDRINQEKHKR